MKKSIILIILFIYYNAYAQVPTIQWQKSFGGSNNENATTVRQTPDGGYIVSGYTLSNNGDVFGNHGSVDYWILKLDTALNVQWKKCFGGSNADQEFDMQLTVDGGYIVAGESASSDGDITGNIGLSDFWIVKLNDTGSIQWQKSFGGSNGEQAHSIKQTIDHGYIIAGFTSSNDSNVAGNHGGHDYWILKIDSLGNMQWQKCLGGSGDEDAWSITQAFDKGYIVAGMTNSNDGDVTFNHGVWDYWVIKLDSLGQLQWQKSYGGSGPEIPYSVVQADDGGYVIAGFSASTNGDVTGNHGGYDYWVVKTDSAGNLIWQKSFGGTDNEVIYSINKTSDGGYICGGASLSNNGDVIGSHGNGDVWLVKINDIGVLQWSKALGGTGADMANCVIQTMDGGYAVAGVSTSPDGDVTINNGGNDFWIIKLYDITTNIEHTKPKSSKLDIYPNPTTNKVNINCEKDFIGEKYYVSNVLGQVIMTGIIINEFSEIDISNLTSGSYFLSIGDSFRQKTLIIKQ